MRIKEKVERGKEKITAHGGTILLRTLEEKLKLKQILDTTIHERRPRTYSPSDIILSTVLMLHTGGRYLEDIGRMAEDTALCQLHHLGRIPHPTTISRWCDYHGTGLPEEIIHPDKPNSETLRILDKVLMSLAKKSIRQSGLKTATIDIDWTGIETDKEESAYTYKGTKGMATLTAFVAETGVCLGSWFRRGNVSPQSDIAAMLSHIVTSLEQDGDIRVTGFRSDSAGYQADIINFCEEHGITYGIRGKMDPAVVKQISAIKETDWEPLIGRNGYEIPGHQVTSVVHSMEKTEKSFRMVVIRKEREYLKEPIPEPSDDRLDTHQFIHFVTATNSELSDSLFTQFYNSRANCEQYIQEAKYGFSLNYLPMSTLNGNAVWSSIVMLAYNLGVLLKQMVLKIHPLSMRMQTLRYRFYQVAARWVSHSGVFTVRLFCTKERFAVFREVLAGCPSG